MGAKDVMRTTSVIQKCTLLVHTKSFSTECKVDKNGLVDPLHLFRYLDSRNYERLDNLLDNWKEQYPDEVTNTPKPTVTYLEKFRQQDPVLVKDRIQKPLNIKLYFDHLNSITLGRNIIYSHQLQSTQTLLFNRLKDFEGDLACVTDIQFGGKGRNDHIWTSPYGCLMFSFKTQIDKAYNLCFMQYLSCIAMVRAIKQIPEYSKINVGIKWPNDIYVDKHVKIGGIICQSVYTKNKFNVITGIGINVSNSLPTTCLDDEASKIKGSPVCVGRSILLAEFFNNMSSILLLFQKYGFEPFHDEYIDMWLHTNQQMTCQDEDGNLSGVTIQNINDEGFLTAINEKGDIVELYPDSTSVNLMDKLIIRRKRN
ncbi:hypothetical protein WA158_008171 [Blastocystis sp. Blastoise]